MARFHSYSFGNCILIAMQRPDATHVAGFHAWKKLGRTVKKGEKGIVIIALLARRREVEDEDEETKPVRVVTGFKAVYVFDVSQTEGKDLPPFAAITGDPGDRIERLESIIRQAGITLEYGPLHCDGVSTDGRIIIKEGLSAAERFAVLVHEAAHLCCESSYVAARTFSAGSAQ